MPRTGSKAKPPPGRPMTPRDEVQQRRSSRTKKMQREQHRYSSDEESTGSSEDAYSSEEEQQQTRRRAYSSEEEQQQTRRRAAPTPQPEPSPAPVVSEARSNMSPAQLKMLELVNKVQDVNLQALQIASDGGDGVGVLDWPQICVVGGQAEGKSTLLSAIVSSRMPSKMKFLPEGTGMVTRCPIEVQMTRPGGVTEHTASVRTQGQYGGGDSRTEEIVGPGANPSPDQIDRWGHKIRKKIEEAQNDLVGPGAVTRDKVIVQLVGPCLPNLSLVDLPGLRAVDDPSTRGLKEELRAMVTDVVRSDNAIILCASAAGTDPATWVGKGLACEVDPAGTRTVGVVTKVDQLYGIPDTQTMRDDRAQLKQEIDRATETQYYAAYNPPAETEQAFRREGISLKQEIESYFQQGHVGNDAIAAALESKLANHLQIQLPGLYKQLKARKAALDKELSTIPNPSWSHVEKVFLSYGRIVQAQANNDGMSQEMVDRKRDVGKHYDSYRKRFVTFDPHKQGLKKGTKAFRDKLQELWAQFEAGVSATAIYDQRGAEDSVLHMSTDEVMQWKNSLTKSTLEDIQELGSEVARGMKKNDEQAAIKMALELSESLDSMMGEILDRIEVDQVPEPDSRGEKIPGTPYYENSTPGIVTLCQDFYKVIAKVKFTLEPGATPGSGNKLAECTVESFPKLNEMLQQATTTLLRNAWKKIRDCADEPQQPANYQVVSATYLDLKNIKQALTNLCDYALDPASFLKGAANSEPTEEPLSTDTHPRPSPQGLPAAKCWKKKPTLRTWPERYIRLMENPGDDRVGLYVFEDEASGIMGDLSQARATSIPNLNGLIVQECAPHSWGMLSSLPPAPKMKVSTAAGEVVAEFAFQTEQEKASFLEACTNLSQGRLWHQCHTEAEEAHDLTTPELEDGQIARQYVRPTTGTKIERWALNGGHLETDHDYNQEKADLLQYASPTFHRFYASLQSHMLHVKTGSTQHADTFFGTSAVKQEVEAEAFRIWALQLVRLQMDKQVSAVRDMYKKLVDATTLDGPFSATAIFAAVGFSSLIVQNLAPSNGRAAGPGPAQLLQVSNGVENREQKEKQQQGLERVLQEFQRAGFPEFS